MTSVINEMLCSGCGNCQDVCRQDCIYFSDNVFQIEQYDCIDCAACREVCPTGAAQIDN